MPWRRNSLDLVGLDDYYFAAVLGPGWSMESAHILYHDHLRAFFFAHVVAMVMRKIDHCAYRDVEGHGCTHRCHGNAAGGSVNAELHRKQLGLVRILAASWVLLTAVVLAQSLHSKNWRKPEEWHGRFRVRVYVCRFWNHHVARGGQH